MFSNRAVMFTYIKLWQFVVIDLHLKPWLNSSSTLKPPAVDLGQILPFDPTYHFVDSTLIYEANDGSTSHLLTWRRCGLWPVLKQVTRGWSRHGRGPRAVTQHLCSSDPDSMDRNLKWSLTSVNVRVQIIRSRSGSTVHMRIRKAMKPEEDLVSVVWSQVKVDQWELCSVCARVRRQVEASRCSFLSFLQINMTETHRVTGQSRRVRLTHTHTHTHTHSYTHTQTHTHTDTRAHTHSLSSTCMILVSCLNGNFSLTFVTCWKLLLPVRTNKIKAALFKISIIQCDG